MLAMTHPAICEFVVILYGDDIGLKSALKIAADISESDI